nr:MAG TPA: hypothetical protein [Herelleviridae sp.]
MLHSEIVRVYPQNHCVIILLSRGMVRRTTSSSVLKSVSGRSHL